MHRAGRTRHAPTIDLLSLQRPDPNRFDLVIADQTMPRMCGLVSASDLLSIRSTLPSIPCIGYPDGLCNEEVRAAGVRSFLRKPVVPCDLFAELQGCLA